MDLGQESVIPCSGGGQCFPSVDFDCHAVFYKKQESINTASRLFFDPRRRNSRETDSLSCDLSLLAKVEKESWMSKLLLWAAFLQSGSISGLGQF